MVDAWRLRWTWLYSCLAIALQSSWSSVLIVVGHDQAEVESPRSRR
jgi:hypothetical protein